MTAEILAARRDAVFHRRPGRPWHPVRVNAPRLRPTVRKALFLLLDVALVALIVGLVAVGYPR